MNFTEKLKRLFFNWLYGIIPNQYSMCEENNILARYDERYIITKSENFVACMELEGFNYNAVNEDGLLSTLLDRINALNALSDDVEARIIAKRRELIYNKSYEINNQYAQEIVNKWEMGQSVYTNRYFIIFETKNKGAKGFLEKKKLELTTSINEDKDTNNITYVNKIAILKATIERYEQTLSLYTPRLLDSNELLRFYGEYINGVYIPFNATNGLLSDSYIGSTVSFHKDYFIQDFNTYKVYNRFIGIKAYDNEQITSLTISAILHSSYELDIYLSIDSISKEKAQSKIKDKIKLAPSFAKQELYELKELIDSDRLNMQNFAYCILVKAKNKEELNEASSDILNQLKNAGLIAVFETLNMQPTFFSMFPNKSFLNARKRIHTSKTIASMILFEKEYIGQTSNSWGNTPVTIFKNQSMSPFMFNFHADTSKKVVGHTMIVGGTGAGKTTLVSFLMANLFKYNIDILALDRLNGLYSVTEFLNGEYNNGDDFYINPCSLPYDNENITFLSSWLNSMIGLNPDATNADEAQKIKAVEKVIRDLYHNLAPQGIEFALKDIREGITKTGDEHIPLQLDRYLENPLFNKDKDSLEFKRKLTTLNMDFIVEKEKDAGLIAHYLFHKMVYRAKNQDKGFFIFIDEFKSYLSNPTFNERINLTLTQARKLNGVMAMAFQDMHQLDGVKNADSFIRNLAHIIIFPTKDIEVFERFNIPLAENEINFLINTGQNERKVLIKNLINNEHSNIVDVNLGKLGKYLKILSSDSDVVQRIKRLKATNPALWKEEFLNGKL
ncbi:FtsK/SpoIIIE domain-containing protein [uncultured Helicobacter sp.]|uniref:VirB4 family type IV secretion/conjugal transfer ATPase n=1 Tax=uncultured Helicobacter sp. TaxID=175537 RepID=UPI0037525D3A